MHEPIPPYNGLYKKGYDDMQGKHTEAAVRQMLPEGQRTEPLPGVVAALLRNGLMRLPKTPQLANGKTHGIA